ncbi:MAG: DUF2637 domain-containing protein [Streptosporangiaceae bacterium]
MPRRRVAGRAGDRGPGTGDRVIRCTTAAVVCAVAAFAAVVSYSHIYGLGRAHGQDGTAARLLPLSVEQAVRAAYVASVGRRCPDGRRGPGGSSPTCEASTRAPWLSRRLRSGAAVSSSPAGHLTAHEHGPRA